MCIIYHNFFDSASKCLDVLSQECLVFYLFSQMKILIQTTKTMEVWELRSYPTLTCWMLQPWCWGLSRLEWNNIKMKAIYVKCHKLIVFSLFWHSNVLYQEVIWTKQDRKDFFLSKFSCACSFEREVSSLEYKLVKWGIRSSVLHKFRIDEIYFSLRKLYLGLC